MGKKFIRMGNTLNEKSVQKSYFPHAYYTFNLGKCSILNIYQKKVSKKMGDVLHGLHLIGS